MMAQDKLATVVEGDQKARLFKAFIFLLLFIYLFIYLFIFSSIHFVSFSLNIFDNDWYNEGL